MSIKLMSHVWETATVNGSDMLVLLALADYGNDQGESIYPSMQSLASKARLSVDQTRRVIHKLIADGVVELVEAGGWRGNRNRPNEYRIVLGSTGKLQAPCMDASTRTGADAGGGTGADASTVLAPVQEDPLLDPPIEPTEEEKPHARDPLSVAWQQAYSGVEMPPKLAKSLKELVTECGMAAAIHGIKASAAKEDGRNFRYIAECARNYVPPAPIFNYANGNGAYHVDIPGVHVLPPVEQPTPAPSLPEPLAIDDPWLATLEEIRPTLTGPAQSWLTGSRMERGEDYEGLPFYRIVVEARAAPGLDWLNKQTSAVIRRTLGSILRQKIVVQIVAEELEVTA